MGDNKCSSYLNLMTGQCTLSDVMREFEMNGSDSPYDPDDVSLWSRQPADLSGLGPSSAYLRQSSWPAPERSPQQKLPRPSPLWFAPTQPHIEVSAIVKQTPTPAAPDLPPIPPVNEDAITIDQLRVLNSLPSTVVYNILKALEQIRGEKRGKIKRFMDECRFCKNNGEREAQYRSHTLRDTAGRVTCPVLRAFVCSRCGASGDNAHTIKYCPLTSEYERFTSTAMRQSIRNSTAVRRRSYSRKDQYAVFGETTPSFLQDMTACTEYGVQGSLDPMWAALEQKIMLNSA